MPIPPNIDPFRALALCFGITLPSDKKRDRDAALEMLCTFLEITPNQRTDFSKTAGPILRDLVKLTTHKGEGWLELPERVDRMTEKIAALNPLLKNAFTPQVEAKLNLLLNNPRIPLSTLSTLFKVLIARAPRTPEDPAAAPRKFCQSLCERHPQAYERALRAYGVLFHSADSEGATESADSGPLHQISRVLARLERAGNYRKRPREAIEAALHAWAGAFEGTMLKALIFIWFIAQPLDKSPEKLIPPQGAAGRAGGTATPEYKKGPIFKEAREWCEAQGFAFPFYPKLDQLRNSQAHEDYTLSASTVELQGHKGVLDRMNVTDLVSRVEQDIHFAYFFDQGLLEAESERVEQSPEVDAAWRAAIVHLPELAQATKPGRKHPGPTKRAKPTKARTKAKITAAAKTTTKVAAKKQTKSAAKPTAKTKVKAAATTTAKPRLAGVARAKSASTARAAATAKASPTAKSKARSADKKTVASRRS